MFKSGTTKFSINNNKLAVISGEGGLPQLIFKEAERIGLEVWAFYPSELDIEAPKNTQLVEFNPLDLEGLFLELKRKKISDVVFAGKITRSTDKYIKLQKSDNLFSNQINPILQQTDDKVLRKIGTLFEDFGFNIRGILEILPNSIASEAILTNKEPSLQDKIDITKALDYLTIISRSDIGQSVVVANGLCLGLETLPGTDAMLDFVKSFKNKAQEDMINSGILYKAIKADQDTRFDVPIVGRTTIRKVKEANLQGIALQKNSVIIIEKDKVVQLADKLDIFIITV